MLRAIAAFLISILTIMLVIFVLNNSRYRKWFFEPNAESTV